MKFFGKEFGKKKPDSHPADVHIRKFLTQSGVNWHYDEATDEYRMDLGGQEFSFIPDNARKHFLQTESVGELIDYVAMTIEVAKIDDVNQHGTLLLKFRPLATLDFETPPTQVKKSQQIGYGLVYEVKTYENSGHIVWANEEMLAEGNLTRETATELALKNLDQALEETTFENLELNGRDVYTLYAPLLFKTSVILAPSFKSRIEPLLGWPVCCVLPDADFIYLFSQETLMALPGMGGVVLRHFEDSPHALSFEFFELNDEGIEAIGRFARREGEDMPSDN